MTPPNPPASTGKKRASGGRFGEFGAWWLALPLSRVRPQVEPFRRPTALPLDPGPSSAALVVTDFVPKAFANEGPDHRHHPARGILEDQRAGHRGLRYPERLGGEKRSGALKNQGKLELSDLEMVACLAGRVRDKIVFSVRGRWVMRVLPAHLRSFLNRWCLGPPAQAGG